MRVNILTITYTHTYTFHKPVCVSVCSFIRVPFNGWLVCVTYLREIRFCVVVVVCNCMCDGLSPLVVDIWSTSLSLSPQVLMYCYCRCYCCWVQIEENLASVQCNAMNGYSIATHSKDSQPHSMSLGEECRCVWRERSHSTVSHLDLFLGKKSPSFKTDVEDMMYIIIIIMLYFWAKLTIL